MLFIEATIAHVAHRHSYHPENTHHRVKYYYSSLKLDKLWILANKKIFYLYVEKPLNPNLKNRRRDVQWYFPLPQPTAYRPPKYILLTIERSNHGPGPGLNLLCLRSLRWINGVCPMTQHPVQSFKGFSPIQQLSLFCIPKFVGSNFSTDVFYIKCLQRRMCSSAWTLFSSHQLFTYRSILALNDTKHWVWIQPSTFPQRLFTLKMVFLWPA